MGSMLGKANPSGAFCPFSELICGPEADALAIVKGGSIATEGGNTVITVKGVAAPASLKSVLDNTSQMIKVAFAVTMDAKITLDASGKVVKVDITALSGTGTASVGVMPATGTASFTYTY